MFILTDGNFYVAQNKNDPTKYNAVIEKERATPFTYKQARALLNNKKARLRWIIKDNYRMINIETKEEVSPNYEGKADVYAGDEITLEDEAIVKDIIDKVELITGIDGVDKTSLEKTRNKLNNMLSFYDCAISDVRHIIRDKSPNAAIRNKIYGVAHELENKREKVKTSMRYVQVLLDSINNGFGITDIKTKLNDAQCEDYKGRTDYYNKIMEWF